MYREARTWYLTVFLCTSMCVRVCVCVCVPACTKHACINARLGKVNTPVKHAFKYA